MNYDLIILDLMNRVCQLEEEVTSLKQQLSAAAEPVSNPVAKAPVRTGRDTTKYKLNGETYGKNRLALAIVNEYKNRHNVTTSAQLTAKGVFEKELQGSLGVIRSLEDVKNSYQEYEKRFFCGKNEPLELADGEFVICSQFSAQNIGRLIDRAKELGIDVTIA